MEEEKVIFHVFSPFFLSLSRKRISRLLKYGSIVIHTTSTPSFAVNGFFFSSSSLYYYCYYDVLLNNNDRLEGSGESWQQTFATITTLYR